MAIANACSCCVASSQDALARSCGRIGTRRIVDAEQSIGGRIVAGSKTGADRARFVTLLASLRKDVVAFWRTAGNPPDDTAVGGPREAEGRSGS